MPRYRERYLRLALRAQGQCRATLETLGVIKNPPTVFAKQANIAAGPQHVNNTLSVGHSAGGELISPRAGNHEIEKSKLLEAHEQERLDAGPAGSARACHQTPPPMGTLDRPANGGGEGPRRAKRIAAGNGGSNAI